MLIIYRIKIWSVLIFQIHINVEFIWHVAKSRVGLGNAVDLLAAERDVGVEQS